jgi:hypothetical protein
VNFVAALAAPSSTIYYPGAAIEAISMPIDIYNLLGGKQSGGK